MSGVGFRPKCFYAIIFRTSCSEMLGVHGIFISLWLAVAIFAINPVFLPFTLQAGIVQAKFYRNYNIRITINTLWLVSFV